VSRPVGILLKISCKVTDKLIFNFQDILLKFHIINTIIDHFHRMASQELFVSSSSQIGQNKVYPNLGRVSLTS